VRNTCLAGKNRAILWKITEGREGVTSLTCLVFFWLLTEEVLPFFCFYSREGSTISGERTKRKARESNENRTTPLNAWIPWY
jgi:hypothetical protein